MAVDPDSRARTHLANERTFLAWFRTGITLVALGLAAAQFLGSGAEDDAVVTWLSTIVIVTGAVLVLLGLVRYRESRRQIDAADYRPAWRSMTAVAAAAIVMAAIGVAFVWILRPGP